MLNSWNQKDGEQKNNAEEKHSIEIDEEIQTENIKMANGKKVLLTWIVRV